MKIVVNCAFGGFHYPEKYCETFGIDSWGWMDYQDNEYRFDNRLISWIEEHPQDCGSLCVRDIPDDATDWQVHDYDGLESIICVIDGKIVWL